MSNPYRFIAPTALFAIALTAACRAQQTTVPSPLPKAEVKFDFSRIGLPVPKYTLNVAEDGAGVYAAQDTSSATPQQIHRDFSITSSTTRKMFEYAHAIQPDNCASKAKNIADTGTKVLTYTTSVATSACTFNYSENKEIEALTNIFQGIAEMLDLGRRLDFLRRFDRLGLDEAIASLTKEVSAGRAVEIGVIEPSLRSVATDPQVMERVRIKAAALIATIPASSPTR